MNVQSAMQLAVRRLALSSSAVAAAGIHVLLRHNATATSAPPNRYRPQPLGTAIRMLTTSTATTATTTLPRLPVFEAVAAHDPNSDAVVHSLSGRRFLYGRILADVARARDRLHHAAGRPLSGERIAFLIENSYDYVVMLLAIMAADAIAVPLSPSFPAPELQYILNHSGASLLVASPRFAAQAAEVLVTKLDQKPAYLELPKHRQDDPGTRKAISLSSTNESTSAGMMLYTSGTTSRPKGVLLPEPVLTAQCRSLLQAWEYAPTDRLLHVLPLHHIHGTVNALLAPLLAGSAIEFLFPFNANAVWNRLAAPFLPTTTTTNTITNTRPPKITFFTVVPTVYSRLLTAHKSLPSATALAARDATSPANLRLNISGSAALPTPVKTAWSDLTRGNVLLERYGMTEVGMALSCGLAMSDRVDASVGWPLPSVEVRLVDTDAENDNDSAVIGPDVLDRPGEIQLRGPTVFREYWRDPDATAREFVRDTSHDGDSAAAAAAAAAPWFRTGDVAVRRAVDGAGTGGDRQPWARGPMYFILGRKTSDIIKTGGEKVSALEIERELLALPAVREAAVVAVPSGSWGQKVAAVLVLDPDQASNGRSASSLELRRALRSRLAAYKIPQVFKIVQHIPRNAMGKINKKQLVKAMFSDDTSGDEK